MLVEVEVKLDEEEMAYDAFDLTSHIKQDIERTIDGIDYDTVVLYLSEDEDLVKLWECRNDTEINKALSEINKIGGLNERNTANR